MRLICYRVLGWYLKGGVSFEWLEAVEVAALSSRGGVSIVG